ncbi:DNA methyltransferase [Peptoniphilus sp. SGI.035]|uniref:DNA methyltransferase n=1 Tax=Peptoniphilus sp. SGI.035 TaxID=3420564 RepID=UPI003D04D240
MKFLDELKKVLSSDKRFIGEDKQIIKTKVSDAARSNDKNLLKALLNNEMLKDSFFTKVDDIYVFDKNKFVWVLESKEFLPDSYTLYKNKIGLVDANDNLISQKQDISLVWPYKDCILEGGQTKEDQKRQEIFYNETLAPEQVNRLLAPKVLGNAKRYTADGVEENIEFNEDDNLIIKGNNLIALSSLLEKYEGQVKCIYIDPPYNTGNDSFKYNDKFNRSTWLTFMKNRLEKAKELLKDDGVIFVQCDDNEQAYLKVLMDEVFGRENFINIVTIETKIGGVSGSAEGKSLKDVTEFINFYAKDKNLINLNKVYRNIPLNQHIQNYKDSGKSWKYTSIITKLGGKKKIKEENGYIFYSYSEFESKSVNAYAKELGLTEDEVYLRYSDKIFRTTNAQSSVRQYVEDKTRNLPETIVGLEYRPIKGKNKGELIEILYKDAKRNMVMFLSDVVRYIDDKPYYQEGITTLWNDILYNNLTLEGDVEFSNGKKPEKIIQRVLGLTTEENDLIMDYHLGSGTTAAVAMKMNRRFIGIEQMDYINTVSTPRLKKVIEGEQGGISKSVNWQGGGSFVYCELLEDNESLVSELEKTKTSEEIRVVFNKAIDNGKLIPSVLPNDLKGTEKDFDNLSIEKQKNLVMEFLDKNKLYVNLSDLEDESFNICDEDKKFTKSFYYKENYNE